MKVMTIEASVSRETMKFEDYPVNTKCIQQSDYADNDGYEFFKPMADYIAQIILKEREF